MADDEKNGRVTTKDFYEYQIKMNADINKGFADLKGELSEMKVERADFHATMTTKVEKLENDSDKRKIIGTAWDGINSLFVSLIAYIEIRSGMK